MDLRSGLKRKMDETGHACIRLIASDYVQGEWIPEELKMLDEAFFKLQNLLKSPLHSVPFTHEEFENFFSLVVHMTSSFHHGDYCGKIYQKFLMAVKTSIQHVVLPYLQGKENDVLLSDTLEIWKKYKVMVGWLCQLLEPLEGYCVTGGDRVCIHSASMHLIAAKVFDPYWEKLRDEVIRLINLEREGVVVNKALISEGTDLFLEIEKYGSIFCMKDFEEHLCSKMHVPGNEKVEVLPTEGGTE